MDTQIVYFGHFYLLVLNHSCNWNSRDGSHQLFVLISDANQPLRSIPRRSQSPPQETSGIVESIGVIVILNIIFSEKPIELY